MLPLDTTAVDAIAEALLKAQRASEPIWYQNFQFWIDAMSLVGLALTLLTFRVARRARALYLRKNRLPSLSRDLATQLDILHTLTDENPLNLDKVKDTTGEIRGILKSILIHSGWAGKLNLFIALHKIGKSNKIDDLDNAQKAKRAGREYQRYLSNLIADSQKGAL